MTYADEAREGWKLLSEVYKWAKLRPRVFWFKVAAVAVVVLVLAVVAWHSLRPSQPLFSLTERQAQSIVDRLKSTARPTRQVMVRVAPTSGRNGHEFAEDLATAFKHAGIDTNSTDFPVPAHYGIRIFAQHETTFVADIKSALDATGIPATVETGPTAPGNDIILSIGDAAKPQ